MSVAVEKRRVILGVTGSIAAYKSAELARYLITRGYQVRVVMTEAATRFISPMTFEALTGHPVTIDLWSEGQPGTIGHIQLADWADVLVVAPASADFIAKFAHGFADSALLAVGLATKARVVIAPAMNVNMLTHPQTEANIDHLRRRGVEFVESESGELACGWEGKGRLAHHREIFFNVRRALTQPDLAGRKVLVVTGPTREAIDPVRFISNRSSGKMGVALAVEAFRRGADVTLIHGPLPMPLKVPRDVTCIPVLSALEMHEKVLEHAFPDALPGADSSSPFDTVIMAAAVADYRPEVTEQQKIKKTSAPNEIPIRPNPDILLELGKRKGSSRYPILVGFAVETGEVDALLSEVRRKLEQKNTDLMVGNLAHDSFDLDTNRVWIVNRGGREQEVSTTYKSRIAVRIIDAMINLF